MGRVGTALAGALAGAAVGVVLLVTLDPTGAYTNDSFRAGATAGFVLRYATLGLVGALLLRALRGGRHRAAAGVGLAIVLALAILPPALDEKTPSEQRRSEATDIEDPERRADADLRAGAIDGCVENGTEEDDRLFREEGIDEQRYCTCFIDAFIEGPEDDLAQLQAMNRELTSGEPSPRAERIARRCVREAS